MSTDAPVWKIAKGGTTAHAFCNNVVSLCCRLFPAAMQTAESRHTRCTVCQERIRGNRHLPTAPVKTTKTVSDMIDEERDQTSEIDP